MRDAMLIRSVTRPRSIAASVWPESRETLPVGSSMFVFPEVSLLMSKPPDLVLDGCWEPLEDDGVEGLLPDDVGMLAPPPDEDGPLP